LREKEKRKIFWEVKYGQRKDRDKWNRERERERERERDVYDENERGRNRYSIPTIILCRESAELMLTAANTLQ
jgi:hypothetical protein